jgi:hypothetical protein
MLVQVLPTLHQQHRVAPQLLQLQSVQVVFTLLCAFVRVLLVVVALTQTAQGRCIVQANIQHACCAKRG